MINEVPRAYLGIGYYSGLSLILWISSVILLFLTFALFLIKSSKVEMKSQKMLYIGYGTFGLFFGISRIFFILGFFNPESYDFFTTLGYITGSIGIIIWLYILETFMIKQTKRIFLIMSLISFGISLIALVGLTDQYVALNLIYITLPISLGAILILYIYLIIKTTGTIRKKASWLLIGLLLIMIGYTMDTEYFLSNFQGIPLEISPSIMIAGILLFLIKQIKN